MSRAESKALLKIINMTDEKKDANTTSLDGLLNDMENERNEENNSTS